MKLYKFRPLTNHNIQDIKNIIRTGEFWCSKLWNLNDPMEGVFTTSPNQQISNIFTNKNDKVICSFSSYRALRYPHIWGYYANGFKGISIEVDVSDRRIHKVNYISRKEFHSLRDINIQDIDELTMDIINTKLLCWKTENEYRFIDSGHERLIPIGKVTAIYFGEPFSNLENAGNVKTNSRKYVEYQIQKRALLGYIKKLKDDSSNFDLEVYDFFPDGSTIRIKLTE